VSRETFLNAGGFTMIDGEFCIGCKGSGECEHGKDACISKRLFVLVMGFADEPGMTDRIEGRVFDMRRLQTDCN
jgi:hypothetical protein